MAAAVSDVAALEAMGSVMDVLSAGQLSAVARIPVEELKRSLMGFVCFSCGEVVDGRDDNEYAHWRRHGCSACEHNLVMNVTTFTVRIVSPSTSIPNQVAVQHTGLCSCLEALHQTRYGNLDWLYPERRKAAQERTRELLKSASMAAASVETKWRAFNVRFDEAISNITRGIAIALGESGGAEWEEPTASEKAASFDGCAPSLEAVAANLAAGRFKNVVVLAGAGISTSAGIPDFRSPGGLYDTLRSEGLARPEDLFSLDVYRERPELFAQRAALLIPHHLRPAAAAAAGAVSEEGPRPTPAHGFLRLLHERGVLRRCYTQNIDDLETAAGIPPSLLVQAHGSFASSRCIEPGCGAVADNSACIAALVSAQVPRCGTCAGLVKPDIVFFGEALSPLYWTMREADMPVADLVIVMGSSLKVQPFAGQAREAGATTPRLLLNAEVVGADSFAGGAGGAGFRCDGREAHASATAPPSAAAPGNYRDVAVLGDVDAACAKLLDAAGWSDAS